MVEEESSLLCSHCGREIAEYDVGGGVYLCRKCYEEWQFNVFQQMDEFGVF